MDKGESETGDRESHLVIIWSLGLKTVRVGSQNFFIWINLTLAAIERPRNLSLIIFHQVHESWIMAYNTSPNINIVPLINFSQVTTACFQQSIFVISVFVPDDIFQLRWWPDDPPLIQQEHCARWSIIPQSSWAHMASIIPSSAKGTHLFPIKSCKSIIKHHQGTNTLPC